MRALTLAREDLRLTLRDRSSIFWIFLAPLIWVYFFGFLAQAPDPSKVKISLTVIQQDDSPLAGRLIEQLKSEGFDLTVIPPGRETGPLGRSVRAVTIPAGFGDAVLRKEKMKLPFTEGSSVNPQGTLAAQVGLHKAVMRMLAEQAFGGMRPEDDVLAVSSGWATTKTIPSGVEQTIPGNLVMFVLIATMTYGAALLAQERRTGVLRRVATTPTTRMEILTGKLLGRMIVAGVQTLVFLTIGLTLFRIGWGRDPLGLALLLVVYIFCAASLSMLTGSLFATADSASGAGIVACLGMSALGGCWWPVEVMPAWMRSLAYAFPTAWALNGLHELISWGGTLSQVLPHCGVIFLFGAAALALAINRLDVTA
ncbi:MAG: ABC transporter permease [Candidatus Polarisedimenticolia bacterium]